ncbi:MAG: hypothetical protein DRO15_02880 [Thermoprotei archaeon]|nr:MAG: hypothetical protein DRO15_02880 [Thermoprotei archaeon]
MGVLTMNFKSFEELALYLISRLSTVTPTTSIACSSEKCYTFTALTDEHFIILRSPPPSSKECRYYYINERGKLICSEKPVLGRPCLTVTWVSKIDVSKELSEGL